MFVHECFVSYFCRDWFGRFQGISWINDLCAEWLSDGLKFVFNPYVNLCGWPGSKHRPTSWLILPQHQKLTDKCQFSVSAWRGRENDRSGYGVLMQLWKAEVWGKGIQWSLISVWVGTSTEVNLGTKLLQTSHQEAAPSTNVRSHKSGAAPTCLKDLPDCSNSLICDQPGPFGGSRKSGMSRLRELIG